MNITTPNKKEKYYLLVNNNSTTHIHNINMSKSNAINNLFEAVKASNVIKYLFNTITIIDSNNNKIPLQTIENINNHNIIIKDIKKTICDSLLNGNSVLLKKREGIDYSISTEKRKPFEDIKQLYLQQIRNNNSYQSPYFMPSQNTRDNGFKIIPKNKSTILSSVNKLNSNIEFTCYYNTDQLQTQKHTLNSIIELLQTKPNIPYLKQDTLPELKSYDPKSFHITEHFTNTISNYFKSIYIGEIYNPPNYSKDDINKIINFIEKDNSNFFKNVQTAHRTIKNGLLTKEQKQQRDHSRRR